MLHWLFGKREFKAVICAAADVVAEVVNVDEFFGPLLAELIQKRAAHYDHEADRFRR